MSLLIVKYLQKTEIPPRDPHVETYLVLEFFLRTRLLLLDDFSCTAPPGLDFNEVELLGLLRVLGCSVRHVGDLVRCCCEDVVYPFLLLDTLLMDDVLFLLAMFFNLYVSFLTRYTLSAVIS